jgi:hypothetical protein
MSGEWNRDLALDLDKVRDWGAAAVVTLLEPKELLLLRVERRTPDTRMLGQSLPWPPEAGHRTPDPIGCFWAMHQHSKTDFYSNEDHALKRLR